MAFCTKCGAANPDGAPACSACGSPMAVRRQFCMTCGAPIPAGMTSCPNCAARASSGAAAPSGGSAFRMAGDLGSTLTRSTPPAEPTYSAPAPSYPNPAPSYPEPTYSAPEPTYAPPSPAPVYSPVPAYSAPPAVNYPARDLSTGPVGAYGGTPPALPHKSDRNWVVILLLSLVTCGIYSIVVMTQITNEVNRVCTPYDHRNSMHYCLMLFLIGGLTLGIGWLVWYNNLCDRIGNELHRRGIDYKFGAGTYWGWGFFGSLIIVGPFIFLHKFTNAVNYMNADYNQRG